MGFFGGELIFEELLTRGNFLFQNGLGLTKMT